MVVHSGAFFLVCIPVGLYFKVTLFSFFWLLDLLVWGFSFQLVLLVVWKIIFGGLGGCCAIPL